LVTSLNEDGQSNVAPKSWLSMMAFEPSLLALGCNLAHWTAQNILHRQEFVVNIPGEELAEVVWRLHTLPHPRPVERIGLTPIPAEKVKPPRIEECKAHLECALVHHLTFGEELIILGQVVAASVDRQAVEAPDPYAYLRLFTFLESEALPEIGWVTEPGRAMLVVSQDERRPRACATSSCTERFWGSPRPGRW
jgi:flavin reductase (DIM6/NTAB) family NADH-FMN oxidoreductase RutF